jgi:hypothetical protein
MLVENKRHAPPPVPSGTECDDNHIPYLTARGKSIAVNFSTNILSRRDRKMRRPCPVGYKMPVENAGKYTICPGGTDKPLHVLFHVT